MTLTCSLIHTLQKLLQATHKDTFWLKTVRRKDIILLHQQQLWVILCLQSQKLSGYPSDLKGQCSTNPSCPSTFITDLVCFKPVILSTLMVNQLHGPFHRGLADIMGYGLWFIMTDTYLLAREQKLLFQLQDLWKGETVGISVLIQGLP